MQVSGNIKEPITFEKNIDLSQEFGGEKNKSCCIHASEGKNKVCKKKPIIENRYNSTSTIFV